MAKADDYHESRRIATLGAWADAILRKGVKLKKKGAKRRPRCLGCRHNYPKIGHDLCGMCKRVQASGVDPVKLGQDRRAKRRAVPESLVAADSHMRAIAREGQSPADRVASGPTGAE